MSGESGIVKLSLEEEAQWKIEWTINDIFSCIEKGVGVEYVSPYFTVNSSKWYLRMDMNGDSNEDSDSENDSDHDSVVWISLYLFPVKDRKFPISVNYTLGLKKADGKIEDIIVFHNHNFNNVDGYGLPKFLATSDLLKKKYELAPSDSLTVVCLLQLKNNLDSTSRLIKLSENFEDLFSSKKFCDVTLKVQNEEIPAHKNILATRSSVFSAMFEVDMKEKNTGIVDIPDCNSGAFKDFLTYLYSGKSLISGINVFNLYRIAHKYDVRELGSDCTDFIENNLSIDNLFDAVILGDQFDKDGIKMKCRDFFIKNFTEIVSTTKWESFLKNNWRLTNELINILATDMKSKNLKIKTEEDEEI